MNKNIKNICVFASSSDNVDRIYYKAAYNLGVEIAKNGYNIVYGGSKLGLMGEVTYSASKNGSDITGVMPEKLYNLGINPGDCTKFILTKDMRSRKQKMDELSDAVIALAGGFGTLEELSEMIVQKQLNYSNKPIVILNTNGYYNSLISFFNEIIKNRFAPKCAETIYYIANTPEEALNYINNYTQSESHYLDSKIKIN